MNQESDTRPALGALKIDSYSHGLVVVDRKAVTGLVGAVASGHEVDSGGVSVISPYIGVAPVAGTEIQAQRSVANRSDIEKLPEPSVPRKAEDLAQWKPGDNVIYKTSGGVAFFGGVGVGILAFGPTYVANGDFTTFVEKTGKNSAYVKVSGSKVKSLSVFSGNALSNIKSSQFQGIDASFSFQFNDLTKPEAKHAYEELIHGYLIPVQQLVKDESPLVTLDVTDNNKQIGKAISTWNGIPFGILNAIDSKTDTQRTIERSSWTQGVLTDAEVATSSTRDETNVLFNKTLHTRESSGSAAKYTDITGAQSNVRDGKVLLGYEKERATAGDLNHSIKEISNFTGIEQLKNAKVVGLKDSEPMNFVGVKFILELPEKTMVALEAKLKDREKVTKDLSAFIHSEFLKYVHAMNWPRDPARETTNVHESLSESDSLDAVKDMMSALDDMKNVGPDDRAGFSKAFRKFGKAMITNSIAFQAGLRLIGDQSVVAGFEVSGERVSRVQKVVTLPARELAKIGEVPTAVDSSGTFVDCSPSGDGIPRQLESLIDIGRRAVDTLMP